MKVTNGTLAALRSFSNLDGGAALRFAEGDRHSEARFGARLIRRATVREMPLPAATLVAATDFARGMAREATFRGEAINRKAAAL